MSWARLTNIEASEDTSKNRSLLEEDLELSNVTELRQNLLPIIDRIEKNPALRLLILKHGKPQAVLMSAPAYEVIKQIMDQTARQLEAVPRAEAIEAAFQRLRGERGGSSALPATHAAQPSQSFSRQLDEAIKTLQLLQRELASSDRSSGSTAIAK